MTRKVIFCSVFFIVCYVLSCVSVAMYYEKDVKNFQKTIDTQKEMLYNKDMEIEELEIQIQELENTNRELTEHQEEVSRGTKRIITCEISAYSSGDGLTPSPIMANGEIAHVGAIACNFLPFGTQVRIHGNIYTVKDRCGVDNCIDIYMDSYEECMEYGRKTMEVEIL